MKAVGLLSFCLLCTASLAAHHSFAAEYDAARPVTITGAVAKIDWTNPHIHFYVDVKDEAGSLTQWKFEGYPPNMPVRQGWKRDATLKPGDLISVFAWRSASMLNMAAAREITFADGHKMTVGPPGHRRSNDECRRNAANRRRRR
jgi:hypothetical protein